MNFKFICLLCACLFLASCSSARVHRTAFDGEIAKSEKIVIEALYQIGRPYQYGGETPSGFDCSGLVQYVYFSVGIELPRISRFQANHGKKISIKLAQKGDLLFFGLAHRVTHVGIVINRNNGFPVMVHSSSSKGVIQTNLANSNYWKRRFLYATRVL